jgi:hypothetical protein
VAISLGVTEGAGDERPDPVGLALADPVGPTPVGEGIAEPLAGTPASVVDGTAVDGPLSVGPPPPSGPGPLVASLVGLRVSDGAVGGVRVGRTVGDAVVEAVGVPLLVGVTGTVTGVDDVPPPGLFGSAPHVNDAPAFAPCAALSSSTVVVNRNVRDPLPALVSARASAVVGSPYVAANWSKAPA